MHNLRNQCGNRSSSQPFPASSDRLAESYSIPFSSLTEACGMKYINGSNIVTYFCAVMY